MTDAADEKPYWQTKRLEDMTESEWERICDGCGRCCLNKLEDEDTGEIYYTNVACRLFDDRDCRCRDYPNRDREVPDCVRLTPQSVRQITWLPPTCGYRLIAEGRPLYWWHPLVSGDPQTVIDVGVSVKGRTFLETEVDPDEWEEHAVEWPEWEPPEHL